MRVTIFLNQKNRKKIYDLTTNKKAKKIEKKRKENVGNGKCQSSSDWDADVRVSRQAVAIWYWLLLFFKKKKLPEISKTNVYKSLTIFKSRI